MENEIKLTTQQVINLIGLAELRVDPLYATTDDISKALIEIERKLHFFDYSLNFFDAESTNVLIVDDMELSIHQLTTMLKKIGVTICVARSKEEAIAELKKKEFHYIIVDLFLPDAQDGCDLIKEAIKIRDAQAKNFKVLAISGTDDKDLIQKCYKLGVDDFVSKQPDWHQKILKFISKNASRSEESECHTYHINNNICAMTVYKINNQKYIDKILKEVNTEVLTGKIHIILNMEFIKIFSDTYANVFAEIYKVTKSKGGVFAIVKPSEDVQRALDYVFLTNAINVFESSEDAVKYIEMCNP